MPIYQMGLLLLALLCGGVGFMGIVWYRCSQKPAQESWGRRLFLATLVALGAGSLVAAWQPDRGLLGLGLAVAALVIGMLWESPASQPTWGIGSWE